MASIAGSSLVGSKVSGIFEDSGTFLKFVRFEVPVESLDSNSICGNYLMVVVYRDPQGLFL